MPPKDWPEPDAWAGGNGPGVRTYSASANLKQFVLTQRADPEVRLYVMSVRDDGWPWGGLSSRKQSTQVMRTIQETRLPTHVTGIELPLWVRPGYKIRLPLTPVWPAFIANTLFYSALVGACWLAPGAIRRRRRTRNNLCIHCAYPIADSTKPCPECGKIAHAHASTIQTDAYHPRLELAKDPPHKSTSRRANPTQFNSPSCVPSAPPW